MGIKSYRPTTPSRRYMTTLTYGEENMTVNAPAKNLTKGLNKKAGRGAGGRISVRRRGGGHKRSYRIIDFKRDKFGVPGKVASIEYAGTD